MDNKETYTKVGLFLGGMVAGVLGLKALKSKEAKKLVVHTAAVALRAKEEALDKVTALQEGADDIVAEAEEVNRQKNADTAQPEVSQD